MQNVARRYGLVCLLHEKPFAGVHGSGKHNNWSMSTDSGINLLEPGDTPHENLLFLFFCAAVIQAVNKHQQLLRASVANAGQDWRLGANEAPPAIISVFLGAELEKVFGAIESGSGDAATPKAFLEMGASVLPRLPLHGGDRNRTSPFAFTGNKFEFRALGSSMSLSFPNTVLNTIVAEAIDDLADKLSEAGGSLEENVLAVVKDAWADNKRVVFSGDNYSEDWHKEAEERGLANLRQSPDALPWMIEPSTTAVFERYEVLTERELHSRYEVAVEQYVVTINIEAETAASIARTLLLPAAIRWLETLQKVGIAKLVDETAALVDEFIEAIFALESANLDESHPEDDHGLDGAKYMQGTVLGAMARVREVADKLERIVPDDLWPLPKYSEILFIK
jgi:glutamine synthetase